MRHRGKRRGRRSSDRAPPGVREVTRTTVENGHVVDDPRPWFEIDRSIVVSIDVVADIPDEALHE